MPRRNRIDIIENMLAILSEKNGKKSTHLMYKANLSHTQMKNYLEELEKKGFIDKNKSYLTTTMQGKKFLEKIKEMKEFENVFGLKK